MSSDYLPEQENEFSNWLANFAVMVELYRDQLDLTAGDSDAMFDANTNLHDSLQAVETAKSTLREQRETKDAARESVTASVRELVRRIQASPTVSPALKAALGLSPRTQKTVLRSPKPPTQLIAEGTASGGITLHWNSNGNAPGTVYLVEAAYGNAADFSSVAAVTATRYTLEGQTAGSHVTFRIRARRRNQISPPTQTVTLYAANRQDGEDFSG